MRLLVTGGTGGPGRALRPLAQAAGHEIAMPGREELDLFNPADAGRALVAALLLPSRIYNVCREEERVSAERFTRAAGGHPRQ
jgi:dTDP-4-dehydrorhamnose reductase